MVKTEFAFLQWFTSSATAKLARQQWRALSSVAACGGGDANEKLSCEQVGQARVSVPVVAGLARASAARGRAVRQPATGVTTRRLISEMVNTIDV